MLSMTVKCGQAVKIGEVAVVKVLYRTGMAVRLAIGTATPEIPITLLADGLVPARFTMGLAGQPRRVIEPAPVASAGGMR